MIPVFKLGGFGEPFSRIKSESFQAPAFPTFSRESVGALGSLYLRGAVVIYGNQLFLSAMGHTAAMTLPEYKDSIEFSGSVRLLHAGEHLVHKRLAIGTNEAWPDDEYVAIGSASISLPPTDAPDAYTLIIEGFYSFGSGVGYNSSSIARETIRIIGVKQ
ncbi:hypothetical protein [Marinobacter zhanjiangensis]|uniref:hypothetical protein n=1 Tax=Marinobacter zhanjiangensis TaxID=578215 RepID=UPI001677FAD7|nr:hypothetical protein [Marinobacter zhanjiangensis]